jgi:D-glycero-beta-D-manno-heptose-7-phosphate kinase
MDIRLQRSLRILVIGESCTDLYRFGQCDRLSPEAPVPIMTQTRTETKPGMAANVALSIRSLGHDSVQITSGMKIIKERFLDERFSQQLLRVDSNDQSDCLDLNKVHAALRSNEFDATVISDYDKGFLPNQVLSKIIPILPRPIFVDSKKKDLSAFEECILKINHLERARAEKFPSVYELITTLGDQGAEWKKEVFPAMNTNDIFDVCGAGDSFLAAIAVKFVETKSMIESIKFANICAGISVKHLGVYNVTKKDLETHEVCVK